MSAASIAASSTTVTAYATSHSTSRATIWSSRALIGISLAFMTFDAALKVLQVAAAVEGSATLGYPGDAVFRIGVIELICVALFALPRTRVIGAVLLTGYLGGAVATHVRVASPLFTHTLFPLYVAAFIWGGVLLRDRAARAVLLSRSR